MTEEEMANNAIKYGSKGVPGHPWDRYPRWYDVSVKDLTVFFLKATVSILPAVALGFIVYVIWFFAAIVTSGLVQQ
jgi:hypothetical protein